MSKFDVAVIGAGLSGLASAVLLHEAGKRVCVLEARQRTGGRIKSVSDEQGKFVADLGPTWVWPMFQPTVARWLKKLELETFPQYVDGHAVVDLGPGKPVQAGIIPTQDGNERVTGGSQALIDALVSRLPDDSLFLNTAVRTMEVSQSGVQIVTGNARLAEVTAAHCVIAVPPRVALSGIKSKPDFEQDLSTALSETPTWMAPHAKFVVVYETAFWRERGLSGRVVSRLGPIIESHDHCGQDGGTAALWGFIGWPHNRRKEVGVSLEDEIRLQLQRCFGDDAPTPLSLIIEDWAGNPITATSADLLGAVQHPNVGPEVLRNPQMDGRLLFAASETAERSPGLIEGAFVSAERVAAHILA